MLWKEFQRPKRVEIEEGSLTPTYGKFVAQPFEPKRFAAGTPYLDRLWTAVTGSLAARGGRGRG